jgi:hypothetical protein
MFARPSVRPGVRATSLRVAILLVGLAPKSAPAAPQAWEDIEPALRGWCTEAPARPAIGGNREAARDDVPRDRAARCRRLAAVRAQALLAYAREYRAAEASAREEGEAQLLALWRESPLYRLADQCRQMQEIGSGRASSAGVCLFGHERLSASPFRFDRLPQKRLWEPEMMRRELSMVVDRHPLGTDAADMLADLTRAGFVCRDAEEGTSADTGECQTSYGAVVYENFEVAWFGAITWLVRYRASVSGVLQNVEVSSIAVGP